MKLPSVVVTGSESTGKSTLAADLATHYGTICCVEFSRDYAEANPAPLDASDVEPIARGQLAREEQHEGQCEGVIIKDTDLISTVVYARHYYGACPQWIVDSARARKADLYLLLGIDTPWIADGVRDRHESREEVHALFVSVLEEFAAAYVVIRGGWEERRRQAADAITVLLA